MIYTHTNVFKIVDRKAFEELRNDFRNVNFKINNNFVSFESYFKPEFDSNFYSKLQSILDSNTVYIETCAKNPGSFEQVTDVTVVTRDFKTSTVAETNVFGALKHPGDKSLRQIFKKTNEFSVSDFDAFAKLAKGLFADYNNGVDVPDEYRIRKFKRNNKISLRSNWNVGYNIPVSELGLLSKDKTYFNSNGDLIPWDCIDDYDEIFDSNNRRVYSFEDDSVNNIDEFVYKVSKLLSKEPFVDIEVVCNQFVRNDRSAYFQRYSAVSVTLPSGKSFYLNANPENMQARNIKRV